MLFFLKMVYYTPKQVGGFNKYMYEIYTVHLVGILRRYSKRYSVFPPGLPAIIVYVVVVSSAPAMFHPSYLSQFK
jgi:hypothetical protein